MDGRKWIRGLTAIVQEEMNLNPFSSSLFVFCGRSKKSLKILYWDKSGFALWWKLLDKERFPWPKNINQEENKNEVLRLTESELQWLLDGIDIWKLKRHKQLNYEKVA